MNTAALMVASVRMAIENNGWDATRDALRSMHASMEEAEKEFDFGIDDIFDMLGMGQVLLMNGVAKEKGEYWSNEQYERANSEITTLITALEEMSTDSFVKATRVLSMYDYT
jgi:hypothetical protein